MKSLYLFWSLLTLSVTTLAQDIDLRKKHYNLSDQVAIQGYDPVAYFVQKKAVKGKKDLAYTYQGVIYHFSSRSYLEIFQKNPGAYEPQYGGWCAYAMGATGEKVQIDPETFKIVDQKLYLFYNRFFNNTLKDWNKDEARLNTRADQSWQKFIR
jgi:YHS domain-containing protein